MHLILSVKVLFHDLVCLKEAVKFLLQLVVLLRQQFLMSVKRIKLLSQVIVPLY